MNDEEKKLWEVLELVEDPELPGISIVELGLIDGVFLQGGTVEVNFLPSYSGCPALQLIQDSIISVLKNHGYEKVLVNKIFEPGWSTDRISDSARIKLKEMGIAAPCGLLSEQLIQFPQKAKVPCPRCESLDTECKSNFGSTACKALFFCRNCLEPFEYFKTLN